MQYVIKHTETPPKLKCDWNSARWRDAEILEISHFRPESSAHRPRAQAKLLYDDEGIYGIFSVRDKYVRCVHTEFQQYVCEDSCVEFFVEPKGAPGYFNFEFNCGGTLLSRLNVVRPGSPDAKEKNRELQEEDRKQIQICCSLPAVVEPEITEDTDWVLEFFIPFAVLEKYAGPLGDIRGQVWRSNFYKCGDKTSHPHWASWSPVDEMSFHLPRCFGTIIFS